MLSLLCYVLVLFLSHIIATSILPQVSSIALQTLDLRQFAEPHNEPLVPTKSPFAQPIVSPLPSFDDIIPFQRKPQRNRLKFGGPIIADINSDGFHDLILTYHKDNIEMYFGDRSGNFSRSPFTMTADIHGVSVAPLTATSPDKLIVLSVGGSNGSNPKLPVFLLAKRNKSITRIFKRELKSITHASIRSRGRISMFMDLNIDTLQRRIERLGGPDILISSYLGQDKIPGDFPKQYAFRNTKGNLSVEEIPGFEDEVQGRAELTDVDGDMVMEVISYQVFRIYRLIASFKFADVTAEVAPGIDILDYTVMAVVEFDMDNDGDF